MPVRKSPNHIPPSPVMKQGIVTILSSDCNKSASIRRTLSADMSSKIWLQQNGFFQPIKKIVSSSSSSSSESGEDEYEETPGQDDVWRSIQAQKEKNEKNDSWGSLLTQKSENSNLLPPVYVHPLVKRSASCSLSEKSLEICTESLGSETGSDCFSSSKCSTEVLSDGDEGKEDGRQRVVGETSKDSDPFADLHVVKYKSSPVRPLPPPLPSIAGGDGASQLHMQSRRENGRLILEAVSVKPRNYFHAQREDGRLVLTLVRNSEVMVEENKSVEEVFDNMEKVGENIPAAEEEEMADDGGSEEEEEFVVEKNLSLPSGIISVHKTGLVMKKLVAVGNMNATWTNKKFNKENVVMTEEDEEFSIPQSLPPPPRAARLIPPPPPPAAASFNAYDYFWRNKTTVSGGFITVPQPTHLKNKNNNNNNKAGYADQDLVLMKRNKAEHFVPYLRGCKEPRRSLLIWEPYCIATS
ncbi:hypothetical protein DH2020_000518 [Rehmannia glutinosa]|uniref:FAF domain-containing protein n=1 Tax=Rehmannia glutinosa TaxID=99300 RepID=A0ABR0XWV1_REHGL